MEKTSVYKEAGTIMGQGGQTRQEGIEYNRRANLAEKWRNAEALLWKYHKLSFSQSYTSLPFTINSCLLEIAYFISVVSYQRLQSKGLHFKKGIFVFYAPLNEGRDGRLLPSFPFPEILSI